MICASCGYINIQGEDFCTNCNEDLSNLDGLSKPKTAMAQSLLEDPIGKLSPQKPITIDEKATIAEAINKMNKSKIGCLLVMEGELLKGIVSERDILMKVLDRKKTTQTVNEIMTTSPETLEESDSIAYGLNKMSIGGFRHIPILREGHPKGIISIRDIFRYITQSVGKS